MSGPPLLALGAHLKNTVALFDNGAVFLSQHIGDLDTPVAMDHFKRVAADLPRLYAAEPAVTACDLHPDYLSTKHAAQLASKSDAVVHPVHVHWIRRMDDVYRTIVTWQLIADAFKLKRCNGIGYITCLSHLYSVARFT
jgi:hydrogenase maturation factor HypF (carbamoyltransferase family)